MAEELMAEEEECSVCRCGFSLEDEGGIRGFIGMIPVAFCPTCYNGVHEMAEQMFGLVPEWQSIEWYDLDDYGPVGVAEENSLCLGYTGASGAKGDAAEVLPLIWDGKSFVDETSGDTVDVTHWSFWPEGPQE